jgi:hypothetical protein
LSRSGRAAAAASAIATASGFLHKTSPVIGFHQVVSLSIHGVPVPGMGPTSCIVVHGPETLLLDCRLHPFGESLSWQHESVRERRLYAVSRTGLPKENWIHSAFGQN